MPTCDIHSSMCADFSFLNGHLSQSRAATGEKMRSQQKESEQEEEDKRKIIRRKSRRRLRVNNTKTREV